MTMQAYLLARQGRLHLDAPIARYWPQFAAADKTSVTVRQAIDHHVGFAYLSNQMGSDGSARARELTLALGATIGA